MKRDEPPKRPADITCPQHTRSGGGRVTGLQAAQVSIRAQLDAWREQFGPREYGTLVDIACRMLEREQEQVSRWFERRAA